MFFSFFLLYFFFFFFFFFNDTATTEIYTLSLHDALPIRSSPDADTVGDLQSLDARLTRVHRDRGWTLTIVVLTVFVLSVLRPRASVLAGAAAVTVGLWLSWTGTTRFWA